MATLSAHRLTCLRGAKLVFEDLSFSLESGGALLLTGPNGSGKSSLLRVLAGLLDPFDGELTLDGRPVSHDRESHRAQIAFIGHADPVKPTLTVRENLRFWADLAGTGGTASLDEALDSLNLGQLAEARGAVLSSGQRRRLSLARLLVSAADIWLMDEPTVGLDTASVRAVETIVAAHRRRGGSVVLSTHVEFRLPGGDTLDLADFTPQGLREEGVG